MTFVRLIYLTEETAEMLNEGVALMSRDSRDYRKSKSIFSKILEWLILIGIAAALFYYRDFVFHAAKVIFRNEPGRINTITETDLKTVLRESQLYTAEYPCNSYTAVYGENGQLKYYVAYNGSVKAGFDVKEMTISLIEDAHLIRIQIPTVEISEVTVDAGSLEYIFANEKYHTETVFSEAYQSAYDDLKLKAQANDNILIAAENNAKRIAKALVEPWVNQLNREMPYEVQVVTASEVQP